MAVGQHRFGIPFWRIAEFTVFVVGLGCSPGEYGVLTHSHMGDLFFRVGLPDPKSAGLLLRLKCGKAFSHDSNGLMGRNQEAFG